MDNKILEDDLRLQALILATKNGINNPEKTIEIAQKYLSFIRNTSKNEIPEEVHEQKNLLLG